METITVQALTELVEAFGLKKRHAQKLTLFAVHRKQWKLSKQMDIETGDLSFEEVIVSFLKSEKKTVIPAQVPDFKTSQASELYQRIVEKL